MSIEAVLRGEARWHIHRGEAFRFLCGLPDDCLDAAITDPPYSSGGAFRGDRTAPTSKKYVGNDVALVRPEFLGDSRDQRSYLAWSSLWLSEVLRATKPGGILCVFSDWRQLPTTTDAVQAGGWIWRGVVTWDKTLATRPQLGRFRSQSEFVVWASKGPLPRRPDIGALPGVFRYASTGWQKAHIATKPVALMRELVRITPKNGVVLDPFAGSGSTGVAALAEGRRFLGCELASVFGEMTADRLRLAAPASAATPTLCA